MISSRVDVIQEEWSLKYSSCLEDSFRDKNENLAPNSKNTWSKGADWLFCKDTGKGHETLNNVIIKRH